MRLFIALDLPAAVRAALADAQSRLRAAGGQVRWADVAGLHLTLQFLGEVNPPPLPALLAALAALAAPPFQLQLADLGAFPDPSSPRVLWAGVAGDTAALAALQSRVVAATAPLGFAAEARPFAPHLTLGRSRPDIGPAERLALAAALRAAAPPTPLTWLAGKPTLFSSSLTPSGPVYTPLGP